MTTQDAMHGAKRIMSNPKLTDVRGKTLDQINERYEELIKELLDETTY